jgi:hypothetical protein
MQKKQRIDEVLDSLEQERQRVDRDLQRLTTAAAYLGAVLAGLNHRPAKRLERVPASKTGHRAVRRRCDPRRR